MKIVNGQIQFYAKPAKAAAAPEPAEAPEKNYGDAEPAPEAEPEVEPEAKPRKGGRGRRGKKA